MTDFVSALISNKTTAFKHNYTLKLHEANNARKKNSDCTLIVAEGDSALTLFNGIAKDTNNFYDNYGTFPLRGKVLNVSGFKDAFNLRKSTKKDSKTGEEKKENAEIKALIEIIGF